MDAPFGRVLEELSLCRQRWLSNTDCGYSFICEGYSNLINLFDIVEKKKYDGTSQHSTHISNILRYRLLLLNCMSETAGKCLEEMKGPGRLILLL